MLTAHHHLALLWISFEMSRVLLCGLRYAFSILQPAMRYSFRVSQYQCRNTIKCHGGFGSLSVTNARPLYRAESIRPAPFYLRQFLPREESASNWWLRRTKFATLSTWLSWKRGRERERERVERETRNRSFSYRAVDEERSQNDQSQQRRAGGSNDLSQSGNRKT